MSIASIEANADDQQMGQFEPLTDLEPQNFSLFERDDSNRWPEIGAEAAPGILSLGCLSPPTPDITANTSAKDAANIYTESLKWYQLNHTDERKEGASGQAESAANSIMDDAWCTCLKVDNPAYGLHKLGTCCRSKGRKERGPCTDFWLCTRCADVKPTGGLTTACDALEHGPSTKCFFCKSIVGGREIFDDPEHEDAHFPKKPSSIELKTAKGKRRKTETNFGFCIHRQHMIMGKLDRNDYKAVVEVIDKFNAESKADKEAKERAVTSPEELLSLTSNNNAAVNNAAEVEQRQEHSVKLPSEDIDIDDDDDDLHRMRRLSQTEALCQLRTKTAYNQDFIVAHVKSLGHNDEWTIHALEDVGDNALDLRWPLDDAMQEEALKWMRKNGCEKDDVKYIVKQTNHFLTNLTVRTARSILKATKPTQIARNHHFQSIKQIEALPRAHQKLKVYDNIIKDDWSLPPDYVLGTSASNRQIREAMRSSEPSEIPLRLLAYNFNGPGQVRAHFVSIFTILLVDPRSKTAWLISSQNPLKGGEGREYIVVPLEKKRGTFTDSQFIIEKAQESRLKAIQKAILDTESTQRLEYSTMHDHSNIVKYIQTLSNAGPDWTIYNAEDMGQEALDKNWPAEANKKTLLELLKNRNCPRPSDEVLDPGPHLTLYAGQVAKSLLEEGVPFQDIERRTHSEGLLRLNREQLEQQINVIYGDFEKNNWNIPFRRSLGTKRGDAELSKLMNSLQPATLLQIDMMVYRFTEKELTDEQMKERDRTSGFYSSEPYMILVHSAERTMWLINGGNILDGKTEFIILPLKRRKKPTTCIRQIDIKRKLAEKRTKKERTSKAPTTERTTADHGVMRSDIEKEEELEKQPKTKINKQQPTKQTSKMKPITRKPAATKARANDQDREHIDLTGTETADQTSSEKPNVICSVDWTELNENGYVLIEKGVSLGIGILNTIQDELKIVRGLQNNDDTSKDDGKRWQMPFPVNSKKEILQLTHDAVMRILENWTPGLRLGKLLVVGSRKDCAIQKPAHTDTDPSSFKANGKAIPLSIFIGLQKETTLRIYEGSHRWIRGHDGRSTLHKNDGKQVKYGKGDILILRGDLVHQGDAFQQQNMRLFVYAHLPDHVEIRDMDGTEIMVTYPVHFD